MDKMGLMDPPILDAIEKVAQTCCGFVNGSQPGKIVMSGCGTSGRVAYLTARRFENILQAGGFCKHESIFEYTIAGGDSALLLSDGMSSISFSSH